MSYKCPFCRQYNSIDNEILLELFTRGIKDEYIETIGLTIKLENKYAKNYKSLLDEFISLY